MQRFILQAAEKVVEYGLVTKAGYAFHPIEVNGIQRRLTPKKRGAKCGGALSPGFERAACQCNLERGSAGLGDWGGGYVSGPIVQAAARKGILTAIHEQNAFPGCHQ